MEQIKIGAGSTVVYEWTEGAFAGNIYQIELLANGKLIWLCLKGSEQDKTATEDTVNIREIAAGVVQISWLESVGYTITVTLVFADNKVFGIASNEKEFYPLTGILREVKSI